MLNSSLAENSKAEMIKDNKHAPRATPQRTATGNARRIPNIVAFDDELSLGFEPKKLWCDAFWTKAETVTHGNPQIHVRRFLVHWPWPSAMPSNSSSSCDDDNDDGDSGQACTDGECHLISPGSERELQLYMISAIGAHEYHTYTEPSIFLCAAHTVS